MVNWDKINLSDRYWYIFQDSRDMIFFFDQTGRVLEMNETAKKQLDLVDEKEDIYIQKIFRTNMKIDDGYVILHNQETGESFETVAYCSNDTCFAVECFFEHLPMESGCYGLCQAHNTVKQTETQKELIYAHEEIQEAHKERNEFVANVTHELRTPVNGIMGLAQNMLDDNLTPEQRESVRIIDQCCRNMNKIINNILDFSKLQAGKFTLENREFQFDKFMDEIVKVNRPQVESKGLKLVCNVAGDIPDRLIGDELRLTQILNNLLSNAIKFTSVGQIVVDVIKSVEIDDTMELFFMVMDTGIGISPQEKDKLFKSFSQVDASITRRFGGTGLGLNIVKQLVEMMGGHINVESEKGKGSTFSFSVRMQRVLEEGVSSVAEAVLESGSASNFHIGAAEEEDFDSQSLYVIGSPENKKEVEANLEKLILCIEMENWEKAEAFSDCLKKLFVNDAVNLKRKAFRLQMTIRKADHDNAVEQYEILKQAWDEELEKQEQE